MDAQSSALILLKNVLFNPHKISPKLLFCLLTYLIPLTHPITFAVGERN